MSGTSRDRADLGEMLLPLDDGGPASPPAPSAPPAPDPPPDPPRPAPPRRSRRGRQEPPSLPKPEVYAEEVVRNIQLRQAEVTETWGDGVDILARQIDAARVRLSEIVAEMREAAERIEQTVGPLAEQLITRIGQVQEMVEAQLAAIGSGVEKARESFAASTREAASNIALARHELALSVEELKRRTFRHGILLGGGTAILVLLAARLLFPFWGMTRADVEAWSRGTELARTYSEASPEERQAILRALKWERMPGALPGPPSASSAPREGGR
jgi:hypothetical protein